MKTNFNSKLFDKQIKFEASHSIHGGGTGTVTHTSSGSGDDYEMHTIYRDEQGRITRIDHCYGNIQ